MDTNSWGFEVTGTFFHGNDGRRYGERCKSGDTVWLLISMRLVREELARCVFCAMVLIWVKPGRAWWAIAAACGMVGRPKREHDSRRMFTCVIRKHGKGR